jgi:hypothetical protein
MKLINHDNWLLADTGGHGRGADAAAWRQAFLAIRLDPTVPAEVARLFEVARGGMVYGYFFQPLLAVGVEQCYRVLESGARSRCAQMGLPVHFADNQGKSHPLSFGHNLSALARHGVIQAADLTLWRQARELRDWVATPEHHKVLNLNYGVTALSRAAELLGKLFKSCEQPK